jgi:hypothetical protein
MMFHDVPIYKSPWLAGRIVDLQRTLPANSTSLGRDFPAFFADDTGDY